MATCQQIRRSPPFVAGSEHSTSETSVSDELANVAPSLSRFDFEKVPKTESGRGHSWRTRNRATLFDLFRRDPWIKTLDDVR